MISKSYSELITFPTFEERYRYLRIGGKVGQTTFGFQRWANQELYNSDFWRDFKGDMVIRDNGCDLAVKDFEIYCSILLHHINPITYDDIIRRSPKIFDPDNVVCTILSTHNAIHYGDESLLFLRPIERSKNDTCPWRH